MVKALRVNKSTLFELLKYTPHPGQKEIHECAASRRIVACGVRWGKTVCASMEGLAAALEPRDRSVGWVVAPTYDLADRVFREIQLAAVTHLRHRIELMRDSDRRLVIRNLGGGLSEIRAKSADNPVSLLGEGLDWLIVDEAARMKPMIWQSHLSQRLIDRQGWALLISTPRGKGLFHDLFRRGQGADPNYKSWNMPSWTNPLLDASLIEEERGRLPERVFRQELGGEFLEGSGQVFRNVRECARGEWQGPAKAHVYFAGLDLAKVSDFTVLVVINEKREVVHFDRFHKLDWSLQVARIKTTLQRYGYATVLTDTTGAGEPVFESMRLESINCSPYPFTARSKTALIDNLAMQLERKEIVLPRPELCPQLIDELEAFQYSVTESGHVSSGAPSGEHDDCVVALALAAWQVQSIVEPRVWTFGRTRW